MDDEVPEKKDLCRRCQRNPASEPHSCPYSEEIAGNYEHQCTCCPDCTRECAYDI